MSGSDGIPELYFGLAVLIVFAKMIADAVVNFAVGMAVGVTIGGSIGRTGVPARLVNIIAFTFLTTAAVFHLVLPTLFVRGLPVTLTLSLIYTVPLFVIVFVFIFMYQMYMLRCGMRLNKMSRVGPLPIGQ